MEGAAAVAVAPSVSCFRDTCNVYVLRAGTDAILVDFGDGDVLDQLAELGVERVTDVLLTHHHRDQIGGLESLLTMVGGRLVYAAGPYARLGLPAPTAPH